MVIGRGTGGCVRRLVGFTFRLCWNRQKVQWHLRIFASGFYGQSWSRLRKFCFPFDHASETYDVFRDRHQVRSHRNTIFVDQHRPIGVRDFKARLTHFAEIGLHVLRKTATNQVVNLQLVTRQKLPAIMVRKEGVRVLFQNVSTVKTGIDGECHKHKIRVRFRDPAMQF